VRRRRAALAAALVWCLCAPPAGAQTAPEPEAETPEALPEGKGRDETFYACTACHSTAIVRQQGMSRENWAAALEWMTERHGLPKFETAERDLILDYLAMAFPPRQRRGFTTPFQPTR
jgi:hypothetical protein